MTNARTAAMSEAAPRSLGLLDGGHWQRALDGFPGEQRSRTLPS